MLKTRVIKFSDGPINSGVTNVANSQEDNMYAEEIEMCPDGLPWAVF